MLKVFAEANLEEGQLKPYLNTLADDYLDLFYRFIWSRLNHPDVKDFGKRFITEIADQNFQLHLFKRFMTTLMNISDDIEDLHRNALRKFITAEDYNEV